MSQAAAKRQAWTWHPCRAALVTTGAIRICPTAMAGLVVGRMDEVELWGAALFRRRSSEPWGCKHKP